MTQLSPTAQVVDTSVAGTWRLYASRPGGGTKEVTVFRGVPTEYGSWTLSDPFGPKQANLLFPKITMFDRVGYGDLDWLVSGTNLDIVWDGPTPYPGGFRVETYVVSFDYGSKGLSVQTQGAMYQADHYLAKPGYLYRPIPYETAIRNAFLDKPDLRLAPMRTEFPADWSTIYRGEPVGTPLYLRPTGVRTGARWTGLVTRQTGSFDQLLTSYVQTLLTSMYTERGRWTLDLDTHRVPVLRHRDALHAGSPGLLVIDPVAPGVDISSLSVDWGQSINVAFGQGTSLAGEGYTGMNVSPDGQRTTYSPLAALRQVHPTSDVNGWLDTSVMRREVSLQLQQGLSLTQARAVALAHLARYSDPGVTGSITLKTDPGYNGGYLNKSLIKAGMSVRLPNLFGDPNGVVAHISEVSTDLKAGTVSLTIDSKYRDALTVDEVRTRGRDSLAVARQLIGGQYSPPVPDQLLPWNYAEGSGYLPSGPNFNAYEMFQDMPDDLVFPYEEWTSTHPPSDPSWASCYMRVPARSRNASQNWGGEHEEFGVRYAFPIRMAQAGTIRRLELAAYDSTGQVLPVRFHFSLYQARKVNVLSMPTITANDAATADGYGVGQRYPFFANAFEQYKTDGTKIQTEQSTTVSSAGLVRGWGTRFVKAGYWPGSPTSDGVATGLLVDEGTFEFDTTGFDADFSEFAARQVSSGAGFLYAMIYCDEQLGQDVYFAGRLIRSEPGSSV